MSDDADKGKNAKGNFFAVDSRLWEKVCALGLNEAVAYLVLARGTGRDNRTTTWSVESIERYTGISRHRAAAALKVLQAKGVVNLLRAGTKPKYDLIPFADLAESDRGQHSTILNHVYLEVLRKERRSSKTVDG